MVLAILANPDVAHLADTDFIAKLETRTFQNSSTASLAEMAERPLSKREAVGSNPTGGSRRWPVGREWLCVCVAQLHSLRSAGIHHTQLQMCVVSGVSPGRAPCVCAQVCVSPELWINGQIRV